MRWNWNTSSDVVYILYEVKLKYVLWRSVYPISSVVYILYEGKLKYASKTAPHTHTHTHTHIYIYIYIYIVMVPTLRTLRNSSYYYEYWEDIHLGVELTLATVSCVSLRARIWPSAGWLTHHFLRPQGAISQAFTSLCGVGFIAWHLRNPSYGGMLTGPKVFLALLGACGLRPCDRTHPKNGLVPHFSGGMENKYLGLLQLNTLAVRLTFNTLLICCIYTFVLYTCFT